MKPLYYLLLAMLVFCVVPTDLEAAPKAKKFKKAGNKALSKGDFEEALKNYLEYAGMTDAEPEINYSIGLCYLSMERPAAAQKYFRTVRSQEWKPYPVEFEFYQARVFHLLSEFDSAHHYYKRFLRRYNKDHVDDKNLQIISEEMVYPAIYGKGYLQNENLISVKQAMEKLIASTEEGHKQQGHGRKVFVQELGSHINSPQDEYAPCISSDGNLLLFASNRSKAEDGKKESKTEHLFFTQKDEEGGFLPSSRIKFEGEGKKNFAPIAYDYNMTGFLLYESISETNGDIFFASRKEDKWGLPEALPEPVNSEYWEPSAAFSKDGSVIYFSSNRPGGKGGLDLYRSTKKDDGSWSTPQNLGPNVNTPFDEDAPYIDPENSVLYFSSRGHAGLGGYDIFRSKLKGGELQPAENLRLPINSPQDDIYFSWTGDGTKAYFSSSREDEGKTNSDIFLMDFSKSTLDVNVFAMADERRIRIRDFKACLYQMPEETLFHCEQQKLKNQATFYIVPGKKYQLRVESEEYGEHVEEVMAEQDFDLVSYITRNVILEMPEIVEDTTPAVVPVVATIEEPEPVAEVEPVEEPKPSSVDKVPFKGGMYGVGDKLPVKVHFLYNREQIATQFSRDQLNMLYDLMENYPSMKVKLYGFADLVGDEGYNLELSKKRVGHVVEYLAARGLSEGRLQTEGDGELNPIVNTESANLENRRIEFEIVAL